MLRDDQNGREERGGWIYRSVTDSGREVRTVSLVHHTAVVLFLLGALGSLTTFLLGQRAERDAIAKAFREELEREIATAARETDQKIFSVRAEIAGSRQRLDDHLTRHDRVGW